MYDIIANHSVALLVPEMAVAALKHLLTCFCLVSVDFVWIIYACWQLGHWGCCLSLSDVVEQLRHQLRWLCWRAADCSRMSPFVGSEWLGWPPASAAVKMSESIASEKATTLLSAQGFCLCTSRSSAPYHGSLLLNFWNFLSSLTDLFACRW